MFEYIGHTPSPLSGYPARYLGRKLWFWRKEPVWKIIIPSKSLILGWIVSPQWYDGRIAFSEDPAAIHTSSPVKVLSSSFTLFEITH
jgi:hypothetical protein